jgi:hypothetical protein
LWFKPWWYKHVEGYLKKGKGNYEARKEEGKEGEGKVTEEGGEEGEKEER